MKKVSTPKTDLDYTQEKETSPKPSTVDFLKMFARCYCYEAKLESKLGNIIMN